MCCLWQVKQVTRCRCFSFTSKQEVLYTSGEEKQHSSYSKEDDADDRTENPDVSVSGIISLQQKNDSNIGLQIKKYLKSNVERIISAESVTNILKFPFTLRHTCACTLVRNPLSAKCVHLFWAEVFYKCKVCDECFSHSDNFTSHLRIHSVQKPYKWQGV